MRFHRLRIELDDVPGRLGQVAVALGSIGVNILDVDVQSSGWASVDEVVADFAVPVDLAAVEHAVRGAGGALLDVSPVDAHELRDRATTALELAASLFHADEAGPGRLSEAARQLAGAELVWHVCGEEAATRHEVVRRVLETRSPAQVEAPVKVLPGGRAWWLGLLLDRRGGDRDVLVLIRRGSRFTFTETARVQALLRLGTLASGRISTELVPLRDGGAIEVRALGPEDLDAVIRLHQRCSASTLHRRYFSPLPSSPERMLRRLVDVDGSSSLGLVAALGTELVGVAHAFRDGCGAVELAFLVEDGHQRRGIGSALFDHLCRRLVALGLCEACILTLPDNDGMRRLMARAAGRSSTWDDGVLRITARLADTPPERTA